jgi:hypothetical protein
MGGRWLAQLEAPPGAAPGRLAEEMRRTRAAPPLNDSVPVHIRLRPAIAQEGVLYGRLLPRTHGQADDPSNPFTVDLEGFHRHERTLPDAKPRSSVPGDRSGGLELRGRACEHFEAAQGRTLTEGTQVWDKQVQTRLEPAA